MHDSLTSSPADHTIIFLPGLGADERLFAPQVAAFGKIIVPLWPEPHRLESLRAYAHRLASTLQPSLPTTPTRALILGGASLGGMIASELASILKPDALILMGTATHPSQVDAKARSLARTSRLLPLAFIDGMRSLAPSVVRSLGPMTPMQKRALLEMTHAVPASFLAWAARAIIEWEGVGESYRTHAKVAIRLHGTHDKIIPPPKDGIDLLIPRAGHVPNFTAADEVNQAIARTIKEAARRLS
jgi:pimeloyl-ACP methyl ester carboxylesterase